MTSFLPYGVQTISDADIQAVVSVLKSAYLTQGPTVERFETSLKKYFHAEHAVAISNATCGLHIAYLAAGVGPGDAVIVPAITFAATSNAALYCGATPIFADIDPVTACMSPESIERCFELAAKARLKVKVIAPVHLAGKPSNLTRIVEIAKARDVIVIEDACHAVGGEYRLNPSDSFQMIGSGKHTAMAVFSFHPVKHLTTGEGGAVLTNDPRVAEKLRMLRSHGITKDASKLTNKTRAMNGSEVNPWYHEMQILGFNYRLCDIQAALGESQMTRIPEFVKRRRDIAAMYDSQLAGVKNLKTPVGDDALTRHGYHLYQVRIDYAAAGISRASMMNRLKEKNVGSQVHYVPVFWHPYYAEHPNLWLADLTPEAERFYATTLSIPMYPTLTNQDVEHVCKTFKQILG